MESRENGEKERESGPQGIQQASVPGPDMESFLWSVVGRKSPADPGSPVGESLLPRVKEEDVYEPQICPWGFCKVFRYGVNTGSSGSGKLTFGKGTILTVHPSKCNRTQQHTGNSGISPQVSRLREMYVAWAPELA